MGITYQKITFPKIYVTDFCLINALVVTYCYQCIWSTKPNMLSWAKVRTSFKKEMCYWYYKFLPTV